jgi:hypothetical protein
MSLSMFGLFTAGLAAFAPLVSAYTTPTGTEPKGNPIALPGLDTIVPAGKDYKITWDPTTQGTVSLILLKGPAENLQFVEAIAEKIPNSGSYSWNVESSLVASEGAKGYGIQLIDDATGQYQYTTQFGISNDAPMVSSSASEAVAPSSYAAAPSSYAAAPSSYAAAPSSYAMSSTASEVAPVSSAVSSVMSSMTEVAATTSASVVAPVVTPAAPYEIPNNTTAVHATGTGSMSTRVASPTGMNGTSVEPSTGSASNMAASFGGLVIAAAVAVFAL